MTCQINNKLTLAPSKKALSLHFNELNKLVSNACKIIETLAEEIITSLDNTKEAIIMRLANKADFYGCSSKSRLLISEIAISKCRQQLDNKLKNILTTMNQITYKFLSNYEFKFYHAFNLQHWTAVQKIKVGRKQFITNYKNLQHDNREMANLVDGLSSRSILKKTYYFFLK